MELAEFLKTKLEQIKSKNPRYSLRSMARKAKLPAGRLSELFSGKRKLSRYYAERLKWGLSLSQEEFLQLEGWISTQSRKTTAEHELNESEMLILASWERFAILNLIKTTDFKSDSNWIADRLGLTKTAVDSSLAVMMKAGLIEKDSKGQIVRRYKTLTSTTGVTSAAIQMTHQSSIQKSLSVMQQTPIQVREFTSITMAIDPKQIDKARKMIDRFQDKVAQVLETGNQSEVYNLNIQLFPLTQVRRK